mmetsp:Transcript_11466/g.31705  ORF Transcript_11466/g.31705 Transcript_11466/m.31705 type:complete len:326 (-) Transcript_11466:359-1336(-)
MPSPRAPGPPPVPHATAPAAGPPLWACRNAVSGVNHLPRDPPAADPDAAELCYEDGSCPPSKECMLNGLTDPCFFARHDSTLAVAFAERFYNETQARRCIAPDRRPGQSALFLMGDSTSDSIRLATRKVVQSAGLAMAHVAMACCPWGMHNIPGEDLSQAECDCSQELDNLQDFLLEQLEQQLRPGDIVLSIAHSNFHLRASAMAWYREVGIPLIERKGAKLVLVVSWPTIPAVCFFLPQQPGCRRPASWPSEALARVAALREEHPSVYAVDLSMPFCSDGGVCTPCLMGSTHVGYTVDGIHLTVYASNIVASFLGQALVDRGLL